ncbi:MAG: isopentenyl-diphosphate delta-isomerase [Cryomorphaceae bacterium]|jgi:isopentenyl-diphosphate delta-isomerase
MVEHVILVDSDNKQLGTMEKMEAHRKGLLHRAFSIFIFNLRDEMLLHQRADGKYHCGGMWTNAVCSHPRPNEDQSLALNRKMLQEMGFFTDVKKAFDFTYRAQLDNGLVEYEYDEVFYGVYEGDLSPNPEEVKAYRYSSVLEIREEIRQNPELFTPWFKFLFERISEYYSSLKDVSNNS